MQAWQQAALGAACLIAMHYLLLRAASGRIGDSLGALILEGTAALGIFIAFLLGLRGDPVETTRGGILFAVLSGLCISGGSILLFFALRRGGPVASTGTIVLGGGVALSALAAPILFREPLTPRRIIGVALGVAAMVVLSTETAPPDAGAQAGEANGSSESGHDLEKKESP
jgi:bacterial/archaeal transporter family protein